MLSNDDPMSDPTILQVAEQVRLYPTQYCGSLSMLRDLADEVIRLSALQSLTAPEEKGMPSEPPFIHAKLTEYDVKLGEYIDALKAHASALRVENERLKVQLAGCGVAALQNTPESIKDRAKPDDYGYSASYADVCRAVDREIALRVERDEAWTVAASHRVALEDWSCEADGCCVPDVLDQRAKKFRDDYHTAKSALARAREEGAAEALERAAKVCETMEADEDRQVFAADPWVVVCAAAIRALLPSPPADGDRGRDRQGEVMRVNGANVLKTLLTLAIVVTGWQCIAYAIDLSATQSMVTSLVTGMMAGVATGLVWPMFGDRGEGAR